MSFLLNLILGIIFTAASIGLIASGSILSVLALFTIPIAYITLSHSIGFIIYLFKN